MKKLAFVLLLMALAAFTANSATAQWFEFSTDLGSDLDRSDPGGIQGNEWMDCGDVYEEPQILGQQPVRQKDDSITPFPTDGDGDGDGPNVGYPYQTALQPSPGLVGAGGSVPTPGITEEYYREYFDLDGEDQLCFEIFMPEHQGPVVVAPQGMNNCIAHEPTVLFLSFDDDGPPGWYNTGDVPTKVLPDRNIEVYQDVGPFVGWSPLTLGAVRDEVALGLGPNPPDTMADDDVDALDLYQSIEECPFWYWSPDHEANMGDDPGGIYMTVMTLAGVNKVQVLDDVMNLGLPQDTDVDAFEFVTVDFETYRDLFGMDPMGALVGDRIVCLLFSVDEDDPDTTIVDDLTGNESGGLMANVVYISNMIGMSVAASAPYEEGDIDALTAVPEPGTISLLLGALAACGVATLRRKR